MCIHTYACMYLLLYTLIVVTIKLKGECVPLQHTLQQLGGEGGGGGARWLSGPMM